MGDFNDHESDSDRSDGFAVTLAKVIGYIIGIPIALLFVASIMGAELQNYWALGKQITGNATDCQAVGGYLDEAADDYRAFNFEHITSLAQFEKMTEDAVRHVRTLDPHEDVEDFHAANLEWWLYMRDDFVGDMQRTLYDDQAAEALMTEVTGPINDELVKLLRECPTETRNFERVLEGLGGSTLRTDQTVAIVVRRSMG